LGWILVFFENRIFGKISTSVCGPEEVDLLKMSQTSLKVADENLTDRRIN